jgi:hypothetical protein
VYQCIIMKQGNLHAISAVFLRFLKKQRAVESHVEIRSSEPKYNCTNHICNPSRKNRTTTQRDSIAHIEIMDITFCGAVMGWYFVPSVPI